MKKNIQYTTIKGLVTAIAALGLIAVPFVQADDERTVVEVDRTPLKADVNATFIDGYTIPTQYRTYFTEVPAIEGENVVVRYHSGRAYYVNSNDWKIVRVVDLDSSLEVAEEDAAMIEGYVIPEDRRTRFIEVPNPDAEVSVRYYNNTAYYLDSSYRIVRTVPLAR